jgi:hypothetical protein
VASIGPIAQKGYFVYNASVKLGPGQRTEKQYLDDNGLEYEEVTMEQFHLIRRPDRRLSIAPVQHTTFIHTDNPMVVSGSMTTSDESNSSYSMANPMAVNTGWEVINNATRAKNAGPSGGISSISPVNGVSGVSSMPNPMHIRPASNFFIANENPTPHDGKTRTVGSDMWRSARTGSDVAVKEK